MKSDAPALDPESARQVRKYADLLLRKADAYGQFPTPVADLVTASKLEIARESALDSVFLGQLYRALPNSFKLMPDRLKKAMGKVVGVLDRGGRTIHLDPDLHPKKVPFVTIHEIGHDFLPWQRETYDLLEDSKGELEPDTRDEYERQANCFASDVLFQLDQFKTDAADLRFGLDSPIELSKRYGTSIYSAIRRYVTESDSPCALVVYNRFETGPGSAPRLALRHPLASRSFSTRFGQVAWPRECVPGTFFYTNRPLSDVTAPIPWRVADRNGTQVDCLVEGFDNTYQIFFLVYPLAGVSKSKAFALASR